MARSSYSVRVEYIGEDNLAQYTFPFKIENLTQLLVIHVNPMGEKVWETRGTDPTYLDHVDFDAVNGGGTVFLKANLGINYRLIILLANDAPVQTFEFKNKFDFTLTRIEQALDQQAGGIQRLAYLAARSMKLSDLNDDEDFDPTLPADIVGKNRAVITTNADGDGLEMGTTVYQLETWKNEAQTAALAAQTSEVNAAASADAAADEATAAALSATNASASATAAAQSATDALANATATADHIADPVNAHAASAIHLAAVAGLTATDVQGAVEELDGVLDLHVANTNNPHGVTKTQVGLSNVNNTSDADKPISTATQTALNLKADSSSLTSHTSASSAHGVTGAVVGTTDAQTLTNKDIDGGTASNTSRITLPKAAKATLDGLTRKQGTIAYASDTKKAYVDDGSSLVEIGSGSGGLKNYITGGDAESGVIGTTYNDGAVSVPVDGAGGTPGISWTVSSSSPLAGTNSFLFSTGSAGDGVAIPFTVDREGQARVLEISFSYEITTWANWTDGRISVWVVAPSGAVIQPSSYQIVKASGPAQFKAVFQTEATGTSYKLCFHLNSSDSSWTSLKVDSIRVGPQSTVNATLVTDWKTDWTPTLTNVTIGNGAVNFRYRFVADTCQMVGSITIGSTTTISGTIGVPLPPGVSLDTSKAAPRANGGATYNVGTASYWDASASRQYDSNDAYITGNVLSVFGYNGTSTASYSNTFPVAYGVNDEIHFNGIEFPVAGRGSSVVASSDSGEGRVVAFKAHRASVDYTSLNMNNSFLKLPFNSVASSGLGYDKTGSFDTSTNRFVAPTTGVYVFSAAAYIFGNTLAARYFLTLIKVGYGEVARGPDVTPTAGTGVQLVLPSAKVELQAGESVEVQMFGAGNNSVSMATLNGSTYVTWFAGEKVQGPAAIAASETVSARYETAAGQTVANATSVVINFDTKIYDTHNAVTTGASWRFTAPVSGRYHVSGLVSYAAATFTNGGYVNLLLFKNGSLYSQLGIYTPEVTQSNVCRVNGSDTVPLIAGEYIEIKTSHAESTSRNLQSGAGNQVHIAIDKAGNL